MKRSRKMLPIVFFFLLVLPCLAFPERLLSAEKFLSTLSTKLEKVKDYTASVVITQGKAVSRGELYYKAPDDLRIDFDEPQGQVLVLDDEKLTVYVPQYQVVLEQSYPQSVEAVEDLPTSRGLATLEREYSVGYLTGPSPVPIQEGSKEMVTKLKLVPLTVTGFQQLILSVKGSIVRRMEGLLQNGDRITLDLEQVRINQGVPASRFLFDAPENTRIVSDWLFNPQS